MQMSSSRWGIEAKGGSERGRSWRVRGGAARVFGGPGPSLRLETGRRIPEGPAGALRGGALRFGAMHSLYSKFKIGLGFLGLCGGRPAVRGGAGPVDLTEEAYQRNHRQYQMLCANCHGAEGKGGLGGSLVDGKWRRGGTPDEVLRSIKTGYPENGMPGYGEASSEADLRGLVAYLFETARRQNAEPGRKTAAAFDRELSAAGEKLWSRRLSPVWTGLAGLAWLPDGGMLATERPGALRIVETGGRLSAPVAGVPAVFVKGQGGMLDVAVHPDYAQNGWIYLKLQPTSGVAGQEAGFTAVARGKIRDGRWVDQQMIFEVPVALHSARAAFSAPGWFSTEGAFVFWNRRSRSRYQRAKPRPSGRQDPPAARRRARAGGQPFCRAGRRVAIGVGLRGAQPAGFGAGRRYPAASETEHGPRGRG